MKLYSSMLKRCGKVNLSISGGKQMLILRELQGFTLELHNVILYKNGRNVCNVTSTTDEPA